MTVRRIWWSAASTWAGSTRARSRATWARPSGKRGRRTWARPVSGVARGYSFSVRRHKRKMQVRVRARPKGWGRRVDRADGSSQSKRHLVARGARRGRSLGLRRWHCRWLRQGRPTRRRWRLRTRTNGRSRRRGGDSPSSSWQWCLLWLRRMRCKLSGRGGWLLLGCRRWRSWRRRLWRLWWRRARRRRLATRRSLSPSRWQCERVLAATN